MPPGKRETVAVSLGEKVRGQDVACETREDTGESIFFKECRVALYIHVLE